MKQILTILFGEVHTSVVNEKRRVSLSLESNSIIFVSYCSASCLTFALTVSALNTRADGLRYPMKFKNSGELTVVNGS